MSQVDLIKILCLASTKIADRKPSLPIIQLISGQTITVPTHMADRAVELGFAEIVGASSEDEKAGFKKNQLMTLGFSEAYIDKLGDIGITSKEDLAMHSHLSILYAFGDDEEKHGRDAADYAQVTMQSRGLSLRPNSVEDLTLIGDHGLSKKTADKFKAVNLVNLSDLVLNTEEELKQIKGIGEGSVQQLVYSLSAIGMALKPAIVIDDEIDLDIQ